MMMNNKRVKEEYLEILWYMQESGKTSISFFRAEIGDKYRQEIVDKLITEENIEVGDSVIYLTEKGRNRTRQLIRSHRLAERLVHDVLGVAYERGACEFEHIINSDLVDSICTLLGHPRECPHGMPIPEGDCCKQRAQTVESSVIPLKSLQIGETARVAYVYAESDQQLHKLDNLLLRPGVELKLHQRYPTFVIECENAVIAIDDEVASNIHVWASSERSRSIKPHGRRRAKKGFRHGFN